MNTFLLLSILLTGSLAQTGCRQALPGGQQQAQVVTEKPAQAEEYRKLSAQEARAELDNDHTIKLVDVRTEEEYREKRLTNSILIPDYDIEKLAPVLLPNKDEKIFLYCRSGRRSRAAAMTLVAMGYTNVYDFGGIVDWPYETVSGK